MKIGRYQLENLVREGIKFLFADLRTDEQRKEFSDPLLASAVSLTAAELRSRLQGAPADSAVLILSQDGVAAAAAAETLEADGFKNVYIVRDGIAALRPSS
jgi:rhodanese-related sulfurtransferase